MSSNPVRRDAAGRAARAAVGKTILAPAKAASKATDYAWKKLGKTPRTTNPTAAKVKRKEYQHDPGGHRAKNLIVKPAAISTAYGQEPTYAHKQAFRAATGQKVQAPKVPFTKRPDPVGDANKDFLKRRRNSN